MSKTHKIYDWDEWKELCEYWGENPQLLADLSIGHPGRPDTEHDYEYVGEYPKGRRNRWVKEFII